ncbi:MAG TPA: universal stress protein [Nocardioidaceae bacterium]
MTTQTQPTDESSTSVPVGVVIVGVDGSDKNQAALEWADREADRLGYRLVLVGATPIFGTPTWGFTRDYGFAELEQDMRDQLDATRARLERPGRDIRVDAATGDATRVLLEAGKHCDLLIVGKRGIGATKRMLVGSTSTAVAGRSPVPVVVVPDSWDQSRQESAPIVVGVTDAERDHEVLEFGFTRADRLGVPLIAAYVWDLPLQVVWSPDDVARWKAEARELLDGVVAQWSKRFPDVEVVSLTPHGNVAMALVDAGEAAQLVVVGRHTGPRHLGGFSLGSKTRALLHYAEFPVAVVPTKHVKSDPLADLG